MSSNIERLIQTGDELAAMLGTSPGIDPMRSVVLKKWREAKEYARATDREAVEAADKEQ